MNLTPSLFLCLQVLPSAGTHTPPERCPECRTLKPALLYRPWWKPVSLARQGRVRDGSGRCVVFLWRA